MTDIRRNLLKLLTRRQLPSLLQIAVSLVLGVVAISPVSAYASEASQCANTKRDTNPDTCEEWVNGNLNQSKASYFEGESIPYRVVLDPALPGNAYEITLGWDAVVSDKNALDYLTSYNFGVTQADPCQGGSLCNLAAPAFTVAIPTDTRMARGRDDLAGNADDIHQPSGDFVIWGGTIQSVSNYHYSPDFAYSGSHEITITLRIVATANRVVLAWGGHIASRLDWGKPNGVVNIKGSPYHMRASGTEYDNQSKLMGNISGIQGDLSLASGAVIFPSYLNVTKETDRATDDTFLFRTNGTGDGVSNGSFTLKNGQTLPIRVEGNSSAFAEEDLSQFLDLYGNPLWMLDSVVCSDNDNVTVPFTRKGDRIDLALGEALEVNCYFKNVFTGLPKLELTKKVIPDAASCDTVDFNSNENETLTIASGDRVRYCYRVRNTGNDIAYDLSLEDDAGTTVLSDDFAVVLGGGDLAEHGKNGAIADLGVAGNAYGEAAVQIGLPVGGSLTNTATASGSDFFDMPISDDDTATVNVTRAQTCTLAAAVSTTGSCEETSAVANVIKGTPLTWCADVCMEEGNSDLNNATVALKSGDTVLQAAAGQTLSAGRCNTWTFDETAGSSSHARRLSAHGVDDFTNLISCMDDATANVFDPNIAVSKWVSLDSHCGNGDDTAQATVYYNTPVWYCFTVRNLGDEDLVDVKLTDPLLGLNHTLPDLSAGSAAWASSAYSYGPISGDIHNTATVTARGSHTRHNVSHDDSADIHMMYADIRVQKTGTAKLNAKENETAVSYAVTATNIGNVTAKRVILTDTLPTLIDYVSDNYGCAYNATNHTLTCDLGDIAPGARNAVEIDITAQLAQPVPIFGIFKNLACAEVTDATTPDINMDNNCDTQATRIVPGATRTIGFWQNHPDFLAQCLALEDNSVTLDRAADGTCGSGTPTQVHGIELGYVKIASEACDDELDATVSSALTGNGNGHTKSLVVPIASADTDSDVETALEAALGALKASPAHWTNGVKRSDLDQARTTAGRQVLATICNVTLLDALRPDFLDDYISVLQGADIEAILKLGAYADTYNNSGDDEPIGDPGSANPDANSDDYTDPSD